MKMKTKKQLEKEIEELNNETDVCEKCISLRAKKINVFCAIHDIEVAETEATLTQTNKIIEMIEKIHKECLTRISNFEKAMSNPDRRLVHYSILRQKDLCEELLTKIKGDGK